MINNPFVDEQDAWSTTTRNKRFNELCYQIEDQLEQHVLVLHDLKKAQAQAFVALSDDFLSYKEDIIHDYLGSLSDQLEFILSRVEELLDNFVKIKNMFYEVCKLCNSSICDHKQ
jgi:hypothetical protein